LHTNYKKTKNAGGLSMSYFNTDTYETKREILNYCKPFYHLFSKPQAKFCTDMVYGLIASQSVLLSDIARALKESINIKYTYKRLNSQFSHFSDDCLAFFQSVYDDAILSMIGDRPIIVVDDSEITKNEGTHFESIGRVRDASTNTIKDGYHLCEMVLLYGKQYHPVKIYSHIYSEKELGFISSNEETKKGLDYCFQLLGDKKAVFVFDRGYDKVDWFKLMNQAGHDFIIRQKSNRNVINGGKTYNIKQLSKTRKGKVKLSTKIKGESYDLYCSHLRVRIPNQKKLEMSLVIIYGYGSTPMMLLTNKEVKNKKELIDIVKLYIVRWRIEEKFKFEKGIFELENIRVRTIKGMNQMNQFMNYCIMIFAKLIEQNGQKMLVTKMLKRAKGLKKNIKLYYYRIANGIKEILHYDQVGIRTFHRIEKRKRFLQLQFTFK